MGALIGYLLGWWLWLIQGDFNQGQNRDGNALWLFVLSGFLLGGYLNIKRTPTTDSLRTWLYAALCYPLVWGVLVGAIAGTAIAHAEVGQVPFYSGYHFLLLFCIRGGLAFLLLHLSSLAFLWAVLPERWMRHLTPLSVLLSVGEGFILRILFTPEPDYSNGFIFAGNLLACILSGHMAACVVKRRTSEKQPDIGAKLTTIVTAGILLGGFLYYYLVCPGRFVTHDKYYWRTDWLTGQVEYLGPG